jgi:hypothetical protein
MAHKKKTNGKDPAVLLYTQDFIVGTITMTHEQRGKYIMLLCLQHQKGKLTLNDLKQYLNEEDIIVAEKFPLHTDGFYYNDRMQMEIDNRKIFTDSRRENGSKGGRPKTTILPNDKPNGYPYDKPNDNHTGDEDVNDNEIKDEVGTSSYSTISYTVAKKLLADLCDWSLSFSMFEEALEEMNSIGFDKLCVIGQISEAQRHKVKECVNIRVEQQN